MVSDMETVSLMGKCTMLSEPEKRISFVGIKIVNNEVANHNYSLFTINYSLF